jgi:hypothetical protein
MPGSEPAGRVYAHVHAAARYGELGQHAKAHGHVLRARSLSTSFGFFPFSGWFGGANGAADVPHPQPPESEREGSNKPLESYQERKKIGDIPGVATAAHLKAAAAIPPRQPYKPTRIQLTGVATDEDLAALPVITPQEQAKRDEEYAKINKIGPASDNIWTKEEDRYR